MNLSENIKKIRERNRISQSELAKRLGVEPTNYPRIEKRGNSLTYEYIELFAKSLEVSVAELLDIPSNNSNDSILETKTLIEENLNLKERVIELEDDKRRLKKQLDEFESRFLNFNGSWVFTYIFQQVEGIMKAIARKQEAIKNDDIEKVKKCSEDVYRAFISSWREIESIEGDMMNDDWSIHNTRFNDVVKDDLMLKSFVGELNMSFFRREYYDAITRYESESNKDFL